MSFVRSSKFRHIFGQPQKDTFTALKVTRNSADSTFCAVNPKFLAFVVQGAGGGPFMVVPVDKTGRISPDSPTVNGHTQQVIELAWNPFNDNLLASCSEDSKIMVWDIPDEGLDKTLTEPWVTLSEHQRRVSLLQWHPSAEYILASGGSDNKVIIWNVSQGEAAFVIPHPDVPTCISWNVDGSLIATTCKDKALRVIDPRKEQILQERPQFYTGSKSSKCVFLKDGNIFAVGFSKMSERLYSLWDLKDLSQPLVMEDIDTANGVIYLHYDPSNNIVFLAGKGDSQIRYYEITGENVYFLSVHVSSSSQRGCTWMPKRGLQVPTCEIARCYRLTETTCEPIGMIVPRKNTDVFQEDIYPPCPSDEPAISAAEWLNGINAVPLTISMKTLFKQQKDSSGAVVKKSNKPIRSLSQKTPKSSSLAVASNQQNGSVLPPGINIEELVDDVKKLKATVRKVCRRLNSLEKQLGEVVDGEGNEEEE